MPHPATLFAILALAVIIISAIAAQLNISVVHPGTGKVIQPVSLLSVTGLHRILTEMVTNFSGFSGLSDIPLMVSFVIVSATINLFMGSASAKWAIMAPVFIPMFMRLGYSPEFTQAAYRIGDSVTNIVSPMMPYFALIVAFMER